MIAFTIGREPPGMQSSARASHRALDYMTSAYLALEDKKGGDAPKRQVVGDRRGV